MIDDANEVIPASGYKSPLSILELRAFAVEGGIYESNRIYKGKSAVRSFSKVFRLSLTLSGFDSPLSRCSGLSCPNLL